MDINCECDPLKISPLIEPRTFHISFTTDTLSISSTTRFSLLCQLFCVVMEDGTSSTYAQRQNQAEDENDKLSQATLAGGAESIGK